MVASGAVTRLAALVAPRPAGGGVASSLRRGAPAPRNRTRVWLCVLAVVGSVLAVAPTAVAQTSSYEDVDDDAYFAEPVAVLSDAGVFAGTLCEAGFCPGEPIDRKTMAVWVVRVLDGRDPSPISGERFDDVDVGSFHAPFIERMAELEVTTGCGDRSGYCPERNVTRAEMAAFISRAYDLPVGPDPGFSDVPADAWYAAYVARLAASKITVGCGDRTRFCHGRDTTRGQMATFLWRAENPDWQSDTTDESDGEEQTEIAAILAGDIAPLDDADHGTGRGYAKGDLSIPVFLCGSEGRHTDSDLTGMVAWLNEEVSPRWSRESSNLMNPTFAEGVIVSPDRSLDGRDIGEALEACQSHIIGTIDSRSPYHLIISSFRSRGGGLGQYGFGAIASFHGFTDSFRFVVDHELGHSVLHLPHSPTCSYLFRLPVPAYSNVNLMCNPFPDPERNPNPSKVGIGHEGSILGDLTRADEGLMLSCHYRKLLGWPIGGDSAPCVLLSPSFPPMSSYKSSMGSDSYSITINWTPPSFTDGVPITQYEITVFRYNPSGSVPIVIDSERYYLPSDARSYTFEGLPTPSQYEVRVVAHTEHGESSRPGHYYNFVPSPAEVWTTDVRPVALKVSWSAVAGADSYLVWNSGPFNPDEFEHIERINRDEIEHGFQSVEEWASEDVTSEDVIRYSGILIRDDTSMWISGLEPDTEYTIKVRACGFSDTVVYLGTMANTCGLETVATVTTPSAPALDVEVTSVGNTWVDLAWQTVPGAEAYAVCGFDDHPVFDYCVYPIASSTEAESRILKEEKFSGLQPGTTYAFDVKWCVEEEVVSESGLLIDEFLCGAPESLSVITAASQTGIAPGRPGPVAARAGYNWMILEWDDVDGADEYTYETIQPRDRTPHTGSWTGPWLEGDDGRPASLIAPSRIAFRFLEPATDYTFEMRACRTEGSTRACSDPRTVTATTASAPATRPAAPDPPTGFSVVNVYAADGCIDATWDPVPGAVEYKLSLNGDPYPSPHERSVLTGTPRNRGDWCGLDPDVTYTIGVSVCKTVGVSIVCSANRTLTVTMPRPDHEH